MSLNVSFCPAGIQRLTVLTSAFSLCLCSAVYKWWKLINVCIKTPLFCSSASQHDSIKDPTGLITVGRLFPLTQWMVGATFFFLLFWEKELFNLIFICLDHLNWGFTQICLYGFVFVTLAAWAGSLASACDLQGNDSLACCEIVGAYCLKRIESSPRDAILPEHSVDMKARGLKQQLTQRRTLTYGPTQITEHTFTQPASHRHIYQQLSTIVSVGVTFLSIRRHPGSEFCKQEKQLTVTKADLLLKERTVSVRRKTQSSQN